MSKAYWVAQVNVTEPVAYARYAEAASEAFRKHGGKILSRAGRVVALEGESKARNVAIEFPSVEAALSCYNSDEYQQAKAHRVDAGQVSLIILEGVEEIAP